MFGIARRWVWLTAGVAVVGAVVAAGLGVPRATLCSTMTVRSGPLVGGQSWIIRRNVCPRGVLADYHTVEIVPQAIVGNTLVYAAYGFPWPTNVVLRGGTLRITLEPGSADGSGAEIEIPFGRDEFRGPIVFDNGRRRS